MRVYRLARHLLVTATALVGVGQCRAVHAGLVTVMNVKPNTDVSLSFTIQIAPNLPPATITRTIRTTTDTAEFGLGDLETEKEIKSVMITKTPKGQAGTITYEVKLSPNGKTLAALEPFGLPTFFAATTSLTTIVQIEPFLNQAPSLSVGDVLSVTDGTTSGIPSLTFLTSGMTPYTGSVTVSSIDLFSVPEPSTLVLLGIAVVGAFTYRCRQAIEANRSCHSPHPAQETAPAPVTHSSAVV